MHPAVLAAMLLAIILVLVLPRQQAMVPLFLIALVTPFGQQLYLGGVHWFVLRTVILTGCVRVAAAKKEMRVAGSSNTLDKAFCLWAVSRAVAFMLLYREGGAVVNQMAFLLDALGGYFVLRYLIQDEDDVARAAKLLVVVTLIMGAGMLNERLRGVNVFGYAGSFSVVPQFRDGQIRAQGAFGHPVLAGVFGATVIPLFFWLWKSGKARGVALAGFAGSTAMVLASASSTPVLAMIASVGGLCLWPIRHYMRGVRWGIVLTLVVLSLVMKAPVWYVIAHVDIVSASSGWHRAQLVDTFVKHWPDWWLIGTKNDASWGSETVDTSNQLVAEGVSGGLVALFWFIVILRRGFGALGTARRLALRGQDRNQEWFLWSLCAVMLSHVVAFWGTAYWDQTRFWWFAFLAIIPVATMRLHSAQNERQSAAPIQADLDYWQPDPAALPQPAQADGQPTTLVDDAAHV